MPIRKQTVAASGLAALLAALALAAPAHATRIKAACTFAGEAKMEDKEDPTLGVRFVGGKGSYRFASLGVGCVGVKDGAPDAQILGVTAQGVYENVVCGTGKVNGTVTTLAGPVKYQNLLIGQKFTIHFISRAGFFFWHDSAKPSLLDLKDGLLSPVTQPNASGTKPTSPKDWQAAGVANLELATQKTPLILPDTSGQNCAKALTISGFVVIDEDDGQGPVPKFP